MKNELWYRLQSVTNAILTDMPKLSSSNIHVFTFVRVKDEQRGKGKDGFKRVDNSNTRWFGGKGKGKHIGSGIFGASAHHANLTSVEDYDWYDEGEDDSANANQARNDPVDPGSDDGEEALDNDDDEENDLSSSFVALDDVTVFEAAELDATALLADTWDDIFDPQVSAQMVQASAQAYLSFGKETGKGKKQWQGQGQMSCSSVTSVIGGPLTTTERTESKNRMPCLWSKGTLGK